MYLHSNGNHCGSILIDGRPGLGSTLVIFTLRPKVTMCMGLLDLPLPKLSNIFCHLLLTSASGKHERDCHLRAKEQDRMGWNGRITEITGAIFF